MPSQRPLRSVGPSVAYLTSYVLSVLGNSIAAIALPLIVLETTGSARDVGVVAAATAIPALAAGLLMGVVIDRVNRRTASIATDLISAAAIAVLPLVDALTGLSVGWFVLAAVIGSLGDVPGLTARDALLPAVIRAGRVPAERLVGLRESLGAIALLVGPAVAGTLMALLDGSTVLWITAGTSAAAALVTLLIPRGVGQITGAPAPDAGRGVAQLREGWRALLGSPLLIGVVAIGVAAAALLAALQGLVLPVYFTSIDSQGLVGLVLSALAGGLLVGSAIYAAIGARHRRRTWLTVSLGGTTAGFAVIATLHSAWTVMAGAFTVGLSTGLSTTLLGVLLVERVAERMRGRILGTQNAMMTAAGPLGITTAALLTESAGVDVAAIVVAGIWAAVTLIALLAPAMRDLEPREGARDPASRRDAVRQPAPQAHT